MAENTRLKELQNDMKKMLEVVEKIRVDVRKEKKISQNDLRDWSLRLRICTKKKKSLWFELRQRSGVQLTISGQKCQASLSSLRW